MPVKTTYEELERKIKFLERELDETRTQAEAFKFTKSIFRTAPLAIGMVVNRVITQANERLCAMLGYTSKELLGREARLLYPTQENYEYVGCEKYKQIREFGVGTVETRWRGKHGEVLDILLSSAPLDPKDWAMGITFTALDITATPNFLADYEYGWESSGLAIINFTNGYVETTTNY